MNNLMRLERTRKQQAGYGCTTDGAGYVLYGNRPDTGKWLERWYPTVEKAKNFCNKKGWKVLEPVDMKAIKAAYDHVYQP